MSLKNNTDVVTYTAIHGYQSVKSFASSDAKDALIETLLKLAVDHDLCDCPTEVSELNAVAIDQWVSIQKQRNHCDSAAETLLAGLFPEAVGKITLREIAMIAQLYKIDKEIKVGAIKESKDSNLELWIICQKNKYDVLEKATNIINLYIEQNRCNVNYVVVLEKQLVNKKTPKFIVFID